MRSNPRAVRRLSSWQILRLLCTLFSVILLGLWVNIFTNRLSGGDYLGTVGSLKWSNLFLATGSVTLVASELMARRRRAVERSDFERRLEILRQRQHLLQKNTLGIVCTLISKTLRVPCNARYFVAVTNEHGNVALAQDRDLAVLNVAMPREFGFTTISVDTPHIVIGRAYRERSPVYEDLPVDHHNWYDARIGRMIDPKQRWVLACPVLALDAETNRHDERNPPHGVICFYGVNDPPAAGKAARVAMSLDYAVQFAEQMSQILNLFEFTQLMAATSNDTETIS